MDHNTASTSRAESPVIHSTCDNGREFVTDKDAPTTDAHANDSGSADEKDSGIMCTPCAFTSDGIANQNLQHQSSEPGKETEVEDVDGDASEEAKDPYVRDGWTDLTDSREIYTRVIKSTKCGIRPQMDWTVVVNAEGWLEDGMVPVDSFQEARFEMGQGDTVHALDMAVLTMDVGDVVEVRTSPRFAYGELGRQPDIPPSASMIYRVELLSADESAGLDKLDTDQMRSIIERKKDRGNYYFKRQEFNSAIDSYKRALKYCDKASPSSKDSEVPEFDQPDPSKSISSLEAMIHSNLAAAYLKNHAYSQAQASADRCLLIDQQNVKAIRRFAQACEKQGKYRMALVALQQLAVIEPENMTVIAEMSRLQLRIEKETKKERELYRKMFSDQSPSSKKRARKVGADRWSWLRYAISVSAVGAVVAAAFAAYRFGAMSSSL